MRIKAFISAAALGLVFTSQLYAKTIPLGDCAQLQEPKTVVLVYATWCKPSRDFLVKYQAVSDKEKYKDWKFYLKVNDDWSEVCGKQMDAVPATYKNNMTKVLVGNASETVLEQFLDKGSSKIVAGGFSAKPKR